MNKLWLKQIEVLDSLRFLGAIFVAIFHYNKFTGTSHMDSSFPYFEYLNYAYVKGGTWVEMFFILSGITFCLVYEERISTHLISFKQFTVKRIARLYPLYWFTTALCIFNYLLINKICNVSIVASGSDNFCLSNLLINFLGIARGWIENISYPYNGPAWTISVEIFCYLIFYLISRFCKKRIRTMIMIIIVIVSVFIVKGNLQYPILNVEIARGTSCFFFGVLFIKLLSLRCVYKKRNILPFIGGGYNYLCLYV